MKMYVLKASVDFKSNALQLSFLLCLRTIYAESKTLEMSKLLIK